MADAKFDQGVRREKDLLPYVVELLPEDEFGDLQFDGDLIFGHGGDGDVTITTNTSLTEDKYYSNLTVNSGKVLNPNGFRVFVKNTLTLNGDLGVKDSVASVSTGSLEGTVAVGQNVVDGLGGSGEPDGYVPGYTFSSSGSVTSSVGVTAPDFYDLRDAINAYKQRGSDFIRVKGGAGGGTGADGIGGAGADGTRGPGASTDHPNYQTVGVPGGKGTTGVAGTGGGGGRGSAVVMVSARQITGSGGLFSEGGAGVSGTTGTPGTPAPDVQITPNPTTVGGNSHNQESGTPGANETPNQPIINHHQNVVSPGTPFAEQIHHVGSTSPGTEFHHSHGGLVNPIAHMMIAGNHHTNADGSAVSPGGVNPVNHMAIPGNHHANPDASGVSPGSVNPVNHHTIAGNQNPDTTNYHTASNPGQHVQVPGSQNPPVPYPGPSGHAPGGHNPTNHSYQPGNHHHSSAVSPGSTNPPTHNTIGGNTNPDTTNHHGTPATHNYPTHVTIGGNPIPDSTNYHATPPTHNYPVHVTIGGNTNAVEHASAHNPDVPDSIHTEVIIPGGVNPDVPNSLYASFTVPGHTNHHGVANAPVTTNYPTEYYMGGVGGPGTDGQRGGRGGGGVLIVVTRNAGTPSYTFNTGVNGNTIALDTANI